jgi:hypothetical protein
MRRGTSEKPPDTIKNSPFIARHAKPANDHYGNTMGRYGDPGACERSVYQALSPPPLEGPGYDANKYLILNLLVWSGFQRPFVFIQMLLMKEVTKDCQCVLITTRNEPNA